MLSIYRFQFLFYVLPSITSSTVEDIDISGFDDFEEAEVFANGKTHHSKTKGEDTVFSIMAAADLKRMKKNDKLAKLAISCDLKAGRLCCYDLNSFVKAAFGKKNHFAALQGVDPAQVTQWNNKNRMVTYTENRGWVLSFERRPIFFE